MDINDKSIVSSAAYDTLNRYLEVVRILVLQNNMLTVGQVSEPLVIEVTDASIYITKVQTLSNIYGKDIILEDTVIANLAIEHSELEAILIAWFDFYPNVTDVTFETGEVISYSEGKITVAYDPELDITYNPKDELEDVTPMSGGYSNQVPTVLPNPNAPPECCDLMESVTLLEYNILKSTNGLVEGALYKISYSITAFPAPYDNIQIEYYSIALTTSALADTGFLDVDMGNGNGFKQFRTEGFAPISTNVILRKIISLDSDASWERAAGFTDAGNVLYLIDNMYDGDYYTKATFIDCKIEQDWTTGVDYSYGTFTNCQFLGDKPTGDVILGNSTFKDVSFEDITGANALNFSNTQATKCQFSNFEIAAGGLIIQNSELRDFSIVSLADPIFKVLGNSRIIDFAVTDIAQLVPFSNGCIIVGNDPDNFRYDGVSKVNAGNLITNDNHTSLTLPKVKDIAPNTQLEYDAIVSPDPNTLFIIPY